MINKKLQNICFCRSIDYCFLDIMDGVNNSNAAEELRREKDRLVEKATGFEKEYE
ncbi:MULTISPECIES: hypothetical protein [Cytobacillus]|uniref:hypothetical protein n=1 Tax=Cytobacillus TaxID=2675230 RepID=UPI001416ED7F|nr:MULTISPECIES: hypothetical protein [Cytobacillus]